MLVRKLKGNLQNNMDKIMLRLFVKTSDIKKSLKVYDWHILSQGIIYFDMLNIKATLTIFFVP